MVHTLYIHPTTTHPTVTASALSSANHHNCMYKEHYSYIILPVCNVPDRLYHKAIYALNNKLLASIYNYLYDGWMEYTSSIAIWLYT